MKNNLADLNDALFAQIARLANDKLNSLEVDKEAKRGHAIVGLADKILRGMDLQVQAAKILADYGKDPTDRLPPGPTQIEAKKP